MHAIITFATFTTAVHGRLTVIRQAYVHMAINILCVNVYVSLYIRTDKKMKLTPQMSVAAAEMKLNVLQSARKNAKPNLIYAHTPIHKS